MTEEVGGHKTRNGNNRKIKIKEIKGKEKENFGRRKNRMQKKINRIKSKCLF